MRGPLNVIIWFLAVGLALAFPFACWGLFGDTAGLVAIVGAVALLVVTFKWTRRLEDRWDGAAYVRWLSALRDRNESTQAIAGATNPRYVLFACIVGDVRAPDDPPWIEARARAIATGIAHAPAGAAHEWQHWVQTRWFDVTAGTGPARSPYRDLLVKAISAQLDAEAAHVASHVAGHH